MIFFKEKANLLRVRLYAFAFFDLPYTLPIFALGSIDTLDHAGVLSVPMALVEAVGDNTELKQKSLWMQFQLIFIIKAI